MTQGINKTVEPTISIQDLNVVLSVIDICAERGSFKGNEMLTIGTLREKIAAFIQHSEALANAAKETPDDELELKE